MQDFVHQPSDGLGLTFQGLVHRTPILRVRFGDILSSNLYVDYIIGQSQDILRHPFLAPEQPKHTWVVVKIIASFP